MLTNKYICLAVPDYIGSILFLFYLSVVVVSFIPLLLAEETKI